MSKTYNLGLSKGRFDNAYVQYFDKAIHVILENNPDIKQINFLSWSGTLPNSKHVIRKGRWYYYRTETKDIYIKVCTPVKDKYAKTVRYKVRRDDLKPMSKELVEALTKATLPTIPSLGEGLMIKWGPKWEEKKDE